MDKECIAKDNSFANDFYASSYRVVDPNEVSFEVDVKIVDSKPTSETDNSSR